MRIPYETHSSKPHPFLSAMDFPGLSGPVSVSAHMFYLRIPSYYEIRGIQGRLACLSALSALPSLLSWGYI